MHDAESATTVLAMHTLPYLGSLRQHGVGCGVWGGVRVCMLQVGCIWCGGAGGGLKRGVFVVVGRVCVDA